MAAWPDHQPGPLQVKASVRPPGGAFGPAQELSPDGVYADLLDVDVSPEGHALAFWREDGDRRCTSPCAHPAVTSGRPAPCRSPTGVYEARFDVGPGGVAVVLYGTDGAVNDEILATVRDPATGIWGALEQVAAVPGSSQPRAGTCGVKIAPSGDILALYSDATRAPAGTCARSTAPPAGRG